MDASEGHERPGDSLRELALFEGLDDPGLAAIAAMARVEQVPEGAVVLREGEPADAVRVILRGRVQVALEVPGREEAIVSTLSRGQMVGFSALLPGARWSATARATKPCEVIALPADALAALCERDHGVGYAVMRNGLRAVVRQLRDARLQLLDVFGGPAGGAP